MPYIFSSEPKIISNWVKMRPELREEKVMLFKANYTPKLDIPKKSAYEVNMTYILDKLELGREMTFEELEKELDGLKFEFGGVSIECPFDIFFCISDKEIDEKYGEELYFILGGAVGYYNADNRSDFCGEEDILLR